MAATFTSEMQNKTSPVVGFRTSIQVEPNQNSQVPYVSPTTANDLNETNGIHLKKEDELIDSNRTNDDINPHNWCLSYSHL